MNEVMPGSEQQFKRRVAYKMRVGEILEGKKVMDGERFGHLDWRGRQVVRVNLIANITDKYLQEGEKKYGSITLDDGSGQVRVKTFGDDVGKFSALEQGDTVMVVGLLRVWNNELYLTPEIIKKKEPAFLLVRKLECDLDKPKEMDAGAVAALKDKILTMVRAAASDGGIDVDKIIMELKEPPAVINSEIKRLLEDGVAYEPRPGKLRYLG